MNSLVIFQEELRPMSEGKSIAVLTEERAAHAYDLHGLRPGVQVKASVFKKGRGSAQVLEASKSEVTLEITLSQSEGPTCFDLDLFIALPRPQTVKKVLETSASFGLRSVHFIRSSGVVKSYFHSPVLSKDQINTHVVKGMEQAFDSEPPEIFVHKLFRPFMEDELPGIVQDIPTQNRIIAHTKGGQGIGSLGSEFKVSSRFALAIGPESGWSEQEIESFHNLGFQVLFFGERFLRVETALTFALGLIQASRSRVQ